MMVASAVVRVVPPNHPHSSDFDALMSSTAFTNEPRKKWAQSSIGGFPSARVERRETSAKLSDVLPAVGSKLRWDYDFGDGWEHDVVCEAITRRAASDLCPAVVDGENACPPDDCGGPWGYGNFVEARADPKHPDHEQRSEWFDGPFDPAHFDLAAHDGAVRRAMPSRW